MSLSSFGKGVRAGRLLDRNLNAASLELLAVYPHAGADDIAGDRGANTGRGSGEDNVAGLQGHDLGYVAQDAGDLVDHQVGRTLLLDLAVDLEPQLNVLGVLDGILGDDLAHGQEGIETLGDVPGQTLLLGLILGVAGRHVNGHGVRYTINKWFWLSFRAQSHTLDSLQSSLGIVSLEIPDRLADDEGKLDLIVHVNALGSQHRALARKDNGRRGLEEEKGLLGLGVVQLSNVLPTWPRGQ